GRVTQQGLHLARKEQRIAIAPPVERLDPHRIACERQRALEHVVERESEDALQTLCQPSHAPLLVAVNQYFGIAATFKAMASCLEFVAQGKLVVDLAVEDGPDRRVLVA